MTRPYGGYYDDLVTYGQNGIVHVLSDVKHPQHVSRPIGFVHFPDKPPPQRARVRPPARATRAVRRVDRGARR